jgi:hypothetical protein
MLKKIAIVIAGLIVAVLGFAATKPDDFRVSRAMKMKASPEKIFALIDDFHQWPSWSPWEKMDPAMKRTLSGAPSGKGAVYEWQGNSDVGKGRMEIIESKPASLVDIKLDFLEPFEGHNVAEFRLEPAGDSTNVTWAMRGPSPFMSKVMQVFMDLDSMIGKDFEAGLTNMKALAER